MPVEVHSSEGLASSSPARTTSWGLHGAPLGPGDHGFFAQYRARRQLDRQPEAKTLRRRTVEHVFGTLKHWMGSAHFLTRRLANVGTEMSLHVLAYNLKRVMSILGNCQNDEGDEPHRPVSPLFCPNKASRHRDTRSNRITARRCHCGVTSSSTVAARRPRTTETLRPVLTQSRPRAYGGEGRLPGISTRRFRFGCSRKWIPKT